MFEFFFWLAREITDGNVKVNLEVGENHYELTLGVCLVLPLIGKSCPIAEGPGEFNVTATIPATSPVSDLKINWL